MLQKVHAKQHLTQGKLSLCSQTPPIEVITQTKTNQTKKNAHTFFKIRAIVTWNATCMTTKIFSRREGVNLLRHSYLCCGGGSIFDRTVVKGTQLYNLHLCTTYTPLQAVAVTPYGLQKNSVVVTGTKLQKLFNRTFLGKASAELHIRPTGGYC